MSEKPQVRPPSSALWFLVYILDLSGFPDELPCGDGQNHMRYTPTEERLFEAMAQMDVIEAHEHLPPEGDTTDSP